MHYCSLQQQALLPSSVTSVTGCCFLFGSVSSFFLELFLHWSPVAYWAPTNLGSSFFSVISFCLFILFMGFSRQEYWSGLPLPSPADHIFPELSTMTHLSWVALHGMAHSHVGEGPKIPPHSQLGWPFAGHMIFINVSICEVGVSVSSGCYNGIHNEKKS